MGSSRNPKAKGQPRQIFSNKEFSVISESSNIEFIGGGGKASTKPKHLLIDLVQIDPNTHELTSIGDSVYVNVIGETAEVFTSNGRLGNVPIHKTNLVISKGFRSGLVANLDSNPNKVKVKLEV